MRFCVRWLALRFFPAVLLLAFALPGDAQDMAAREQQLRQRVEEVYELFNAADWRGAEQYLTEDSKSLWMAQPKGKHEGYRIESIQVAQDGLRADVTVLTTFRIPMAPTAPFTMPQKTEWLYLNDEWFLKFKPSPTIADLIGTSGQKQQQFTPYVLESPIRFDQNPVMIPPTARGMETVVHVPFHNVSGEVARIRGLRASCTCLRVEVDKTNLQPNESGTLTVTYRGLNRPPQRPAIGATLHPGTYLLNLRVNLAPAPGEQTGAETPVTSDEPAVAP